MEYNSCPKENCSRFFVLELYLKIDLFSAVFVIYGYMDFYQFFQAFTASDITFATKPYFSGPFCTQDVREGLVVAFLTHVNDVCEVRHIDFTFISLSNQI